MKLSWKSGSSGIYPSVPVKMYLRVPLSSWGGTLDIILCKLWLIINLWGSSLSMFLISVVIANVKTGSHSEELDWYSECLIGSDILGIPPVPCLQALHGLTLNLSTWVRITNSPFHASWAILSFFTTPLHTFPGNWRITNWFIKLGVNEASGPEETHYLFTKLRKIRRLAHFGW